MSAKGKQSKCKLCGKLVQWSFNNVCKNCLRDMLNILLIEKDNELWQQLFEKTNK